MAARCASIALCIVGAIANALNATAGALIDTAEIIVAQKAWADGIVEIGASSTAGLDYAGSAARFVDRVYAYNTTDVLFKPTVAREAAFRLSRYSAICYVIGGCAEYPEDHGFALKPWTAIEFRNAGISVRAGMTMAMGAYYFTDPTGAVTKVEYSFGYIRCDVTGKPRIVLHHSSLPYTPPQQQSGSLLSVLLAAGAVVVTAAFAGRKVLF